MSSYPSSQQIAQMFDFQRGGQHNTDVFADDVEWEVMTDHPKLNKGPGSSGIQDMFKRLRQDVFDKNEKDVETEVTHVLGGGDSPWACAEMQTTGSTKNGKKFVHRSALVMHFGSNKKIDKARMYLDSHKIHEYA